MADQMTRQRMLEFARRTGLSPRAREPRRYLWTDAFAVCNYLGLYGHSGEQQFMDLALELVDQVHHTLGRHRTDDPRSGWISGLGEAEGERHPTAGGLRIGKDEPERGPTEPYDEIGEWERDGQYFHYLTKWMHALHRVARVTGRPQYHRWAVELAATAVERFIQRTASGKPERMYWKMSIDLGRPLVASMGQHDPLDGYITCNQLQRCLPEGGAAGTLPDLDDEIALLAGICRGQNWATGDALGIGGLLWDAWRLAQMMLECGLDRPDLLADLLAAAVAGVQSFVHSDALRLPAAYRLPFREFGLSIGLRAAQRMLESPELFRIDARLHGPVTVLMGYWPLVEEIEAFWLDPVNQQVGTWREHLDINEVMLATSLAPDGFLSV